MTEWPVGTGGGLGERALVAHRTYDWRETAPVEGIIQTIAEATGRSFEALPPLERVVSTDAVSALLATPTRRGPESGLEVTFRYEELIVTVYSTGQVELFDA